MFSKKGASLNNARTGFSLPREVAVVADPSTINIPSSERPGCPDQLEQDIKDFKVFIKKNLVLEKPAPDLLVKIHQRIDAIKLHE